MPRHNLYYTPPFSKDEHIPVEVNWDDPKKRTLAITILRDSKYYLKGDAFHVDYDELENFTLVRIE